MPKLIEMLNKNNMTLVVALPQNDTELAEAAVKGGADALQLHINTHGFGDFAEEKENLAKVIKAVKVPVGIMTGDKKQAGRKEMEKMVKMGADFFNIDMENMPEYAAKVKGPSKIIALGPRFTIDLVLGVQKYNAEAVDATIIPAAGWGKNLLVGDLQNYISIVLSAGIPVIVPTEKRIHPSEVAIISDAGAKGILLTPLITGTTAKHVHDATRLYRAAVDDLG